MTVVSAKEFNSFQDKYFNLALSEQVFIQNDNYMFLLTRADELKNEYKEPDEDFYRAIPIDDFVKKVKNNIHKYYEAKKNESILIA